MRDPHRTVFKRGGGGLALFGLPFMLFGLFFTVMALGGHVETDGGQAVSPTAGVAISSVFTLIGAILVFGRIGVTIDVRIGYVRQWWGLLFPWRTKEHRLSDFDRITLGKEVVRSDKSTQIVFPVRLEGSGEPIALRREGDYQSGRRAAESAARRLGLPLHDSTSGATIVRPSDRLDESIRDRARRSGERPVWSDPPEGCRIDRRATAEATVFRLPVAPFNPLLFLLFVPSLIFVGFFLAVFAVPFWSDAGGEGDSALFGAIFGAFMSLFIIAPIAAPAVMILRGRAREEVVVSAAGLRLTRRFPIGRRRWELPIEEIEELEWVERSSRFAGEIDEEHRARMEALGGLFSLFIKPGAILARGDRASCEFGGSLTAEERRWLKGAVEFILTAPNEREAGRTAA